MWRALTGLIAIALIAGCGALGSLLNTDTGTVVPPTCVAHYEPLGPGVSLGLDDCGNYWVRDDADSSCSIISGDGQSMIPIPCPAEGDTLGD